MSPPLCLRTVQDMRQQVAAWRSEGLRVGLVPTMGALHEGHLSLVRRARQEADRIIVSIFVNPTQFAPSEDFGSYPRTFDADMMLLTREKAEAVYAPLPNEIYPAGFDLSLHIGGPAKAGLEDRFRPTFFQGVATVVAKLFTQSQPDCAVFGEKDFQQLAVIRQLVRDLDLPVKIIGAPTLREADGLALSSRNVYLSPSERQTAPLLHQSLQAIREGLRHGRAADVLIADESEKLTKAGFGIDYLEWRDAHSLGPVQAGPNRLLIAAKLGQTRLIDNIAAD
jgi:pantoate--beta-alanine ligase